MGNTPLGCAAKNGHKGVAEALLGRKEIDPDKEGDDDQTPLILAICNRHEGVAKMLLGREDVSQQVK